MSDNPMTTRQITFHGHVQGVFFRKTAESFAKVLRIKGYVKNLSSGAVELVAQGSVEAVAELLGQIMSHYKSNITECESVERPNGPTYSEFEIRH